MKHSQFNLRLKYLKAWPGPAEPYLVPFIQYIYPFSPSELSQSSTKMSPTYEESRMGLIAHAYPIDEKWAMNQDDLVNSNECPETGGRCCRRSSNGKQRNAFVKGGMIALVVSLLALVSFLITAVLCPGAHALLKRQNNGSTNNESAFTHDRLWIIIVCVVG